MKRIVLVSALAFATTVAAQAAPPPVMHVRGTVSAVSMNSVTVATAKGSVVVKLAPTTRYVGVVPATVDQIKTGTFIGTANVPGPGSAARALEVVVFPAAMKGTGEGDYAWDLPGGGGHMSAMTNGTDAAPKTSMMTNATVTHLQNGPNKTVTLSYTGGTKVVSIPPGAPIVAMVKASKALVAVGSHVVIAPSPTGARAVIIGERGAIPPM